MTQEENSDAIQMPETLKNVNLEELCTICHITPDFIIELVAYGTVEPSGNSSTSWLFDSRQLHVIQTATRLHQDLEVNHAGIALAIDLLQQVENLQMELATLKKYFNNK